MGTSPPKITINTDLSPRQSPPKVVPSKDNSGKDWANDSKVTLRSHADYDVHSDFFDLPPSQLECLVDPKNAHALVELGGIEEIAERLHTNIDQGLTDENINDDHKMENRVHYYGKNVLPERQPKSLLQLMWIAFQDKVLIILSIAAVVSLALGLYETFGQPDEYDDEGRKKPKVDWVEGVAILVAVIIVVVVGSVNDWQKERQFVKLNRKKEDRVVKAIRNGTPCEISVFDILVGDILVAEPGELIPVDGVVLQSNDLKCDESAASGESATVKKFGAKAVEALAAADNYLNPTSTQLDAFLLSGARVLEGTGSYLVIAVGPNSMHGRTMLSLQEDPESTPLQEKLNAIAEGIAKFGLLAAVILFIALMIRFFTQLPGSTQTSAQKGEAFMQVLITAITIVVVAVPEGLPLAVTLALAFATTRMIRDNNLVRVLKSCETMGSATSVCSDKTGTLTQNKMTVVAGTIGLGNEFHLDTQNALRSDSDHPNNSRQHVSGPSPKQVIDEQPLSTNKLLLESIALNSSAFEAQPGSQELYIGSKTEVAMLTFAQNYLSLGNLSDYRKASNIIKVFPFDSRKKYMATVICDDEQKETYRILLKGASEVVLRRCSSIIDPMTLQQMDLSTSKDKIISKIDTYASQSLRTIGVVYKEIPATTFESLLKDNSLSDEDLHAKLFSDFAFVGLVGIMDPLRPGVRAAVEACHKAGVSVRMVTGDNIITAKAIARECGILNDVLINGGPEISMEGPDFRKLDVFELKRIVPRLRVLARSSPQDKKKLVKFLKSCGEVVAVTGDGINDVPALKAADIGFSMGISGTEVAKEASEIILMDDNFGSIVKAMMWGRTVNDAVKKFLQFQLTVNVTAVLLTFVSAVANSDNSSVLTAVQLLWVNLIMDTFAALALATDPPAPSVLDRMPDSRRASLISVTMWKMILGQAILQLVITFVLHFAGKQIFFSGKGSISARQQEELNAMVFNTFVWLQFFNMFVNRRLDNKMNILEGITKNYFFMAIVVIIGGFQIMIMFVGGAAFSIREISGAMWATSIICGVTSIPMAMLLRLMPDEWVMKCYPKWLSWIIWRLTHMKKRKTPGIVLHDDEESHVGIPDYRWNYGIERVRDELQFIKTVKGGRVSALKFRPREIYTTLRGSLTPSSAGSERSESPVTTLRTSSYSMTAQDTEHGASAGDVGGLSSPGFLTVPGAGLSPNTRRSNHSMSSGTTQGGDHSPNISGGHSPTIGAFAMIPAIVGGAIAGWNPEQVPQGEMESTSNEAASPGQDPSSR